MRQCQLGLGVREGVKVGKKYHISWGMDWWLTHVTELINEKAKLKEDFTKYEEEMVELSVQVVEHQATCKTLSCENDLLNEILSEISKNDPKVKGKGSKIQFQRS